MSEKKNKKAKPNEKPLSTDAFSTDGSELEIVGDETEQQTTSEAEARDETSNSGNDIEQLKSDYLYLRAEFDNFKRQAIKERSELVKFGNERLIVELLNVLDIFDSALRMDVSEENLKSFREGIEMTATEFKNVLSRFGVSVEDPKGKPFDPSVHEALSSEPNSDIEPGHISQVFKKAYKLHDRVIRPAQVVVAKTPEKDPN